VNVYVDLFMSFARIGAFTFGGGYAMLPMIQKEIVEKHQWATDEEVMDYFAVAQCTPGVIAVNSATFVGTKVKGVLGGAAATLGVIFPAIVIISVIAMVLQSFADIPAVQHAVGQGRRLHALPLFLCYKGHLAGFIPEQKIPEFTCIVLRRSMDYCKVFLFKSIFSNLPGKF